MTTSLTHYGSYRTVVPFDPPTQNTTKGMTVWLGYINLVLHPKCFHSTCHAGTLDALEIDPYLAT